jgi:lipoprotein-anchoring transpeptidase ErfK/SrfK
MTLVSTLVALAIAAQAAPAGQHASKDTDGFALQVALDRAGFSSGVIDGRVGTNTKRAMEEYQKQTGRDPEPIAEPLVQYRITANDVAGPFVERIPTDLMEQSKLPALSYRSVAEALAERFHTTPEVLERLNANASFAADETIVVPNVEPLVMPSATAGTSGRQNGPQRAVAMETNEIIVRVSKSSSSLSVTGPDGKIVLFAPVTTGSENDPLPIGEWKVNGVHFNPQFRYNPDLFWDANPAHTKATIPPGPNGPVGLVWIDLSKEHYGIHGSPEPAQIGKTQSHGCVRLTNWDALKLASLVRPGTKVLFVE